MSSKPVESTSTTTLSDGENITTTLTSFTASTLISTSNSTASAEDRIMEYSTVTVAITPSPIIITTSEVVVEDVALAARSSQLLLLPSLPTYDPVTASNSNAHHTGTVAEVGINLDDVVNTRRKEERDEATAGGDLVVVEAGTAAGATVEEKQQQQAQVKAYQAICKSLDIIPNSQILTLLSTVGKISELNLRRNYFGPKGILALAELLQYLPTLNTLNLSSNYLTNEQLIPILPCLTSHPTLTCILLNDNPVGTATLEAWIEKESECKSRSSKKLSRRVELQKTPTLNYHKRKLEALLFVPSEGEVE